MPDPEDFLDVASLLVQEAAALQESSSLWTDRDDARARSAVSRGYYSVFRELKQALIPHRVEWARRPASFPSSDIHRRMYSALSESLGAGHPLVLSYNQLRRRRNECDYDLDPPWNCDRAERELESAEDAIGEVRLLTRDQLADIAFRIASP